MKKKRKSYDKYEIRRKGNIEENIDKLKKDLGVYLEGAKDIKYDKEKEEEFISPVKREKVEEEKSSLNIEDNFVEKPKKKSIQKLEVEDRIELKFNKKSLIIPAVVFLLFIFLGKFSIFKYATKPKEDIDIPGIKIKSIFYYNIFGKKLKEKAILIIGNKTVIIPISIEKWINLPKEKKLKYIKVFQKE